MKTEDKINVLLAEYGKLKDEQINRINYRDSLVYLIFGILGGVITIFEFKPERAFILLIIPFISIVLAWVYILNDKKISAIGRYFRENLIPGFDTEMENQAKAPLLAWEDSPIRKGKMRPFFKFMQLIINQLLFVVSGIICITLFLQICVANNFPVTLMHWIIIGIESLMLIIVGIILIIYSDIRSKKKSK